LTGEQTIVRCKQTLMLTCLAALLAGPASAQEWARKMFQTTSHDFGTVAAGAKAEYRFVFKNLYKETVRIASVSTSCQCVTPYAPRATAKSLETAELVTVFNTETFRGKRDVRVTVTFDQPFAAQVQLLLTGFIRGDVVFNPGNINFGRVECGKPVERLVEIDYAGRDAWEIVDVRTANPYLEAELYNPTRGGGRVKYQMLIRLRADAPVGFMKDQLSIITNDEANGRIPLDVIGKVESTVTVSDTQLVFGQLRPGEKVTKNVMVRGKRPFRITGVQCDDCVEVRTTDATKPYHVLPVTFIAHKAGRVEAKIHIETDLGQGLVPEISAYADVVEGP
jgi:hypothetical protein